MEEWLEKGQIRVSDSPWASPIHVVPKDEDDIRVCGDFRSLNAKTVPDAYRVPQLRDHMHNLEGCRVFSKVDINHAFLQIPIASKDVYKTAITTPFGNYEFVKMPFGLKNSGQTFQRVLDSVLRGTKGVFGYVDDLLGATKTMEEHDEVLKDLFHRLKRSGLTVNEKKSKYRQAEVEYLGFSVFHQ